MDREIDIEINSEYTKNFNIKYRLGLAGLVFTIYRLFFFTM